MKEKGNKIPGPAPAGKKAAENLPSGGVSGFTVMKSPAEAMGQTGGSPKVFKTDEQPKVTKVGSNPSLNPGKTKVFG